MRAFWVLVLELLNQRHDDRALLERNAGSKRSDRRNRPAAAARV